MTVLGDAVDLGTETLAERFPSGLGGVDPELVAATVIDVAWPELHQFFWEKHQVELERILLKNERLTKIYNEAKSLLEYNQNRFEPETPFSKKLRRAIEQYEGENDIRSQN